MIYVRKNEIISLPSARPEEEDMALRQELLDKHPYKYWEGKDGNWYVYVPDKEKGRILKKRKNQAGIEKVIIDYQKNLIENPTLEELFNEWNDYRLELKKISKASHTRLKQVYKRHFKEFGQRRVRDITEEEYIEFLERQIPEHNLSARAFSSLKTITKGMLKRAKRHKYIRFSPELMLADLDVSENEFAKSYKEDYEQVFDEEETAIMINYLTDNYNLRNAGVLLLFISGMRIGELVALKHEDLDTWRNTVKIRRTETRYNMDGKTYHEVKDYPKTKSGIREIVIPTDYKWLVRDLYYHSEEDDYVFIEKDGRRMVTDRIRKRLYKVCKETGVYKKSPHKIRATYDTILLDAGVDGRMVKDQMGHADIKTSENNYHRNRKTLDRKKEIIDSIGEFHSKVINQ